MSRKLNIGIVAVAVMLVGGWALAYQQMHKPLPATPVNFSVVVLADATMLLDSQSGNTWVLDASIEGTSVWLPVRLLKGDDQVYQYLHTEDTVAERAKEEEDKVPGLEAMRSHKMDIRRKFEHEHPPVQVMAVQVRPR